MIARPGPPLSVAEAARRARRHGGAFAVAVGARDVVGCAPQSVVRGGDVALLQDAWRHAQARWRGGAASVVGAGVPAEVPVAVGFLSYDLGRRFEDLPSRALDDHGFPEMEMRFVDALWERDRRTGACRVLAASEASARALGERLAAPAEEPDGVDEPGASLAPEEPGARHLANVRRVLGYLEAGEAYQVNVARRLSARVGPGAGAALDLWRALGQVAPAPFAIWLDEVGGEAGCAIVGNSPERFLRLDGRGGVATMPIKGTRPRGADAAADEREARALLDSAKDAAEHVMIVDLERNDLGRVCRIGSVEVRDLMRLVTLPTVHHLESTVVGVLRADVGLPELLAATFPGGSVTGAPKKRAMEIIDELEPHRRGPYTGATGWLGAAGDLDLAVAIRTATFRGGVLRLWVGGGIVIDSNPEAELAETETKAEAFRRALAATRAA